MKQLPQNQGRHGHVDYMERDMTQFLIDNKINFIRNHESRLDYYLPDLDLFIEVKRFYTPRAIEQMSRVADKDVILIQGIKAFKKLMSIVERKRNDT